MGKKGKLLLVESCHDSFLFELNDLLIFVLGKQVVLFQCVELLNSIYFFKFLIKNKRLFYYQ